MSWFSFSCVTTSLFFFTTGPWRIKAACDNKLLGIYPGGLIISRLHAWRPTASELALRLSNRRSCNDELSTTGSRGRTAARRFHLRGRSDTARPARASPGRRCRRRTGMQAHRLNGDRCTPRERTIRPAIGVPRYLQGCRRRQRRNRSAALAIRSNADVNVRFVWNMCLRLTSVVSYRPG